MTDTSSIAPEPIEQRTAPTPRSPSATTERKQHRIPHLFDSTYSGATSDPQATDDDRREILGLLPLREDADEDEVWTDIVEQIGVFRRLREAELPTAPKKERLASLERLEQLASADELARGLRSLIEYLELVQDSNPALYAELSRSRSLGRFRPLLESLTESEGPLIAIERAIHSASHELRSAAAREDGRGKRPNPPSNQELANRLLRVWLEYTPEGTGAGRNSGYAESQGAFHAFVRRCGQVVDQDFSGASEARTAWDNQEQSMQQER